MFSTWVRRLYKNLLSPLLLVFSLAQPLLAQTTVQQYFSQLSGYQIVKLDRSTEERDSTDPFNSDILDEYILLSHTLWAIQPTNSPLTSPLELEIYEMQDPLGAFGVFSNGHNSSQEEPPERLKLPVDNYYLNQSLIFWRGNYFFDLSAPGHEQIPKQALQDFAYRMIEVIPQLNLHPLTVLHLPREGLIRESIRFYLGEASFDLNRHFPRDLISPMGFDKDIEVTAAQYSPGGHMLYLIGYPTTALAAEYFVKLQNAMESYFSPQGVYMRRSGVIISIFFGPESVAREILVKVQYAPTIKWISRKDPDPEALREYALTVLGVVRKTV
ncbi:hypothetical protein MYX82_02950, partial [Acidobacteria bacterium AH-259-D05]|nr:hypothetical protein [Acidobacteria bacterium AH-259-D05]